MREAAVPVELVRQVDAALADLDVVRARLDEAVAEDLPLLQLRASYAEVRHAYERAETLLRRAAALAKPRSYREWSRWRHRVSSLSTSRTIHQLAEQDIGGLLPLGSVRAIDTGMTGPAIGDLLHGESREPGTPPTYGLDLEALLTAAPDLAPPRERRSDDAPVIDLSPLHAGSTPAAA